MCAKWLSINSSENRHMIRAMKDADMFISLCQGHLQARAKYVCMYTPVHSYWMS